MANKENKNPKTLKQKFKKEISTEASIQTNGNSIIPKC